MKLLVVLTILLSYGFCCIAQNSTANNLDSLKQLLTPAQLDSFNNIIALLENDEEPTNYADISISGYNGQLSSTTVRNSPVLYTNGLLFSLSCNYNLKSGIFLSYDNIFATANNKSQLLQHALTLGYEKQKKDAYFLNISLFKNFTKDSGTFDATPVDVGINATFKFLKTKIQPTISIAYDKGNFVERIRTPLNKIRSFDSKISTFNAVLGVQSTFDNYENELAKVSVVFTPKILLNGGSQKYSTEIPVRRTRLPNAAGANGNLIQRNLTENFSFQSIGLDLDAIIGIGNFYITPSLYIDNSFVDTDQFKKISAYGSLTLGYTF